MAEAKMRRTTLWVEPDLMALVQAEAERRGESVSAATRRFWRNYTRKKT